MRLIVFGFVFMLVAVPAAQAQQPQLPRSTEQLDLRPVEAPIGVTRAATAPAEAAPASTQALQARHTAGAAAAYVDPSARNALAIIGAIVVVVAVIALLR